MRLEIVCGVVTCVTEDLTGRKTYSRLVTVKMHIEFLEIMGTIQATVGYVKTWARFEAAVRVDQEFKVDTEKHSYEL